MDDHQLLQQFLADRSDRAFTELVRRHIDLVYSAAIRQVKDPATAQDVTQRVFVTLARKAATIRNREALAGWLLVTTRSAALDALRMQARRRRHEQEAAAMRQEAHTPTAPDWQSIQPLLDDLMSQLKGPDRDAVAMRYFQDQSVAEVAVFLGVSPAAAQKRVHRAVSRLRELFARHGVKTTADALGMVLAGNVIAPAPPALLGQVTQSALSAAPAIASTQTAKGLAAIMAMTKMNTAIWAAAGIILLAGVATPLVYRSRSSSSGSAAVAAAGRFVQGRPINEKWQADFHDVYALRTGEVIKRVAPPFIPARLEFVKSASQTNIRIDPGRGFTPSTDVPTSYLIIDDGHDLRPQWTNSGEQPDLADALYNIAGVWPQETDIPRDKLLKEVTGDWVARQDATTAQKLDGLAREVLGQGMTLKSEPMERDVIVVRGQLNYRPLPSASRQHASDGTVQITTGAGPGMMQIFLYRGSDKIEATNHSNSLSQSDFLQELGQMLGRPVVVEAQLGEERPVMAHSLTSERYFLRATDSTDPSTADEMLKIISEQTSLQFTRQRRTVPTWRLVKAER